GCTPLRVGMRTPDAGAGSDSVAGARPSRLRAPSAAPPSVRGPRRMVGGCWTVERGLVRGASGAGADGGAAPRRGRAPMAVEPPVVVRCVGIDTPGVGRDVRARVGATVPVGATVRAGAVRVAGGRASGWRETARVPLVAGVVVVRRANGSVETRPAGASRGAHRGTATERPAAAGPRRPGLLRTRSPDGRDGPR